jgi:hypothetical protein
MVCGVDKLGQGIWCKDGLDALTLALSQHKHIRSCSLYLNYLGPKARGAIKRCLLNSSPSLTVFNLQFTDLFPKHENPSTESTTSTTVNGGSGGGGSGGDAHHANNNQSSSSNIGGAPGLLSSKAIAIAAAAESDLRGIAAESGVNLEL